MQNRLSIFEGVQFLYFSLRNHMVMQVLFSIYYPTTYFFSSLKNKDSSRDLFKIDPH